MNIELLKQAKKIKDLISSGDIANQKNGLIFLLSLPEDSNELIHHFLKGYSDEFIELVTPLVFDKGFLNLQYESSTVLIESSDRSLLLSYKFSFEKIPNVGHSCKVVFKTKMTNDDLYGSVEHNVYYGIKYMFNQMDKKVELCPVPETSFNRLKGNIRNILKVI